MAFDALAFLASPLLPSDNRHLSHNHLVPVLVMTKRESTDPES